MTEEYKERNEDVKKAEQAAIDMQARHHNDWVNVMNTDSGKRIIAGLMHHCGHMTPIFDKHNSEMCRKSGKSEIGFHIQNELVKHAPDQLLDIMQNPAKLFANDH